MIAKAAVIPFAEVLNRMMTVTSGVNTRTALKIVVVGAGRVEEDVVTENKPVLLLVALPSEPVVVGAIRLIVVLGRKTKFGWPKRPKEGRRKGKREIKGKICGNKC